jgi:transcriptional regulator with XRE-family HTH domain
MTTASLPERIAAEVRAELGRQRMSQRRLAAKLDLSQAQVNDRLRGSVEFRLSELEQIAEILGVPLRQFFDAPAAVAGHAR